MLVWIVGWVDVDLVFLGGVRWFWYIVVVVFVYVFVVVVDIFDCNNVWWVSLGWNDGLGGIRIYVVCNGWKGRDWWNGLYNGI